MSQAVGTFTIDAWDQDEVTAADGATVGRAVVRKTFAGEGQIVAGPDGHTFTLEHGL